MTNIGMKESKKKDPPNGHNSTGLPEVSRPSKATAKEQVTEWQVSYLFISAPFAKGWQRERQREARASRSLLGGRREIENNSRGVYLWEIV